MTDRKDPGQTFPRRQMGTVNIEEFIGGDRELQELAEAQQAVVDAAALVRTLRKDAGLSQRELAKRARTTQAQVSAVERAVGSQGPTVELLARLVAACGEKLALVPARTVAAPKRLTKQDLRTTGWVLRMRVGEVMTGIAQALKSGVEITTPQATIQEVARKMADLDATFLTVSEGDRLVGMITDRDIAVRSVAKGKGPDCPVREVMTPEVRYVFEDEDIAQVAKSMADVKVRRLPVLSRDKRLVGIVSLGEIAIQGGSGNVAPGATGERLKKSRNDAPSKP